MLLKKRITGFIAYAVLLYSTSLTGGIVDVTKINANTKSILNCASVVGDNSQLVNVTNSPGAVVALGGVDCSGISQTSESVIVSRKVALSEPIGAPSAPKEINLGQIIKSVSRSKIALPSEINESIIISYQPTQSNIGESIIKFKIEKIDNPPKEYNKKTLSAYTYYRQLQEPNSTRSSSWTRLGYAILDKDDNQMDITAQSNGDLTVKLKDLNATMRLGEVIIPNSSQQ